jgi:hypothetical protein
LFWEEENGPSVLKGLFAMDQEKSSRYHIRKRETERKSLLFSLNRI